MNYENYFNRIRNLQNQISFAMAPVVISQISITESLTPLLKTQEKLNHSIAPIVTLQKQLQSLISPSFEWQKSFCQQIGELLTNYTNKDLKLSSEFSNVISKQQSIISILANSPIDISCQYLAEDTSQEIYSVSSNLLAGLEEVVPQHTHINTVQIDTSLSSNKLSWQDVLLIITSIITILSFAQQLLPNNQLLEIQNSLNCIIELERQQLMDSEFVIDKSVE